MSRKRIDITGKLFGKLIALYPIGAHWLCLCECGKEIKKRLKDLNKMVKRTRHGSCGCNKGLADQESRINNFIGTYKYGAKIRNLAFKLSKKLAKELIFHNCFYCERKPYHSYGESNKQYKGSNLICNGIDRVNNNRGYYKNNIVTACKECNLLRSDKFTQEETKVMAMALRNYRETK